MVSAPEYRFPYYRNHDFLQQEYSKNDKSGFEQLNLILNSLSTPEDIKIGFESTANYALNLELFLENANHSFIEINPVLIKDFKKSQTLRHTKTDSIDCKLNNPLVNDC